MGLYSLECDYSIDKGFHVSFLILVVACGIEGDSRSGCLIDPLQCIMIQQRRPI